ncbi:MAG: nitrophenyl compound nitroreductase subunit ArsF family protein [Desulfobacteraceae bacterium]|nr:nitrophenyl compound nitroreductase subunit ArsF family protein [Desulfobacteraceae bacterium]
MQLIQKQKYVFTWLFFFMLAFAVQTVSAGDKATEVQKPAHSIVVTYFHNTIRCPTCHKIEEQSTQAIKFHFENELKTGKLVFRVINVDEPANEHYNTDYQLYTKSLIVSEMKDGKEVRWKNLEKIWEFVHDEEQFDNYVYTEIKDWLKE